MDEKRGQFTFYRSFWEAAQELENPQDRLSYLEAVIAFALDGEELQVRKKARSSFILSKPTLLASARKARAGKLGGAVKQTANKTEANAKQSVSKPEANWKQNGSKTEANDKQTASKKENKKENKIEIENECLYSAGARTRFVPPTVEQVREYVTAQKYHVDADAFVAWYASNGWRVAKNPMRDWQAAVRTWERKDMERNAIGNRPKYQPGTQPGGSDRPAPTADDVERMKRFLEKLKGEENETENVG